MISPAVLAGALWIFHACAPDAPASILAGIALQESGYDPTAIYDNTARFSYSGSHSPGSPNAAVDLAVSLVARGHQIDVGLLGIDYTDWVRHDTPIMAAFDGCANARLSEQVLMGDYAGALKAGYRGRAAWFAALSAYNSGGYVTSVGARYAEDVFANIKALAPRLAVAQAALDGRQGLMVAPRSGALPRALPAPLSPTAQAQPRQSVEPTPAGQRSDAFAQALAIAKERQKEAREHYGAIVRKLTSALPVRKGGAAKHPGGGH